MLKRAMSIGSGLLVVCAVSPAVTSEKIATPLVRRDRPRIFLRAKAWDGPSVEKISEWMKRPEYQRRAKKLSGKTIGNAILYLMTGDEAAGRQALEGLKRFTISGSSPSYSGIEAQQCAALYDWLHDHPDFDQASRTDRIGHLEHWGDYYLNYLKGGGPTPFYSRLSGALAGLTAIGLSLHGDSPKADEYVRYAASHLREKIGTIRQAEDGATGGGSYGYHHEFTDLANLVAAWRSATDWDAARWIKEHQGDWLQRQLLFQIWTTYPNGWFVKDGDIWSGSHTDRTQFRMHIDAITGMYRNGFGRSWANRIASRWPKWEGWPSDYHTEYVWQFFVFNDPEVPARPLEELGRAEVFSPRLHGIVCWRDSWRPDATIIHFKCGETVDHHSTQDQGRFLIFRHTPLAIKNGIYSDYGSPHHRYYKSPWSTNSVVFTGPNFAGQQPNIDFDGTPSWQEWKAARDRRVKRPPTGVLLATEANDRFARALGDLSGSTHPTGSTWVRELVFLGYRYLLVLDRVKAGAGLSHRWTLHTINEPSVDGQRAVADNGAGRLFCRTLLPVAAKLAKVGGPGHEFEYNGHNRLPKKWGEREFPPEMQLGGWRLDVTPADGAAECVYLHVLFPTDATTDAMPPCSVERRGTDLIVTVGDLKYTFSGARSFSARTG